MPYDPNLIILFIIILILILILIGDIKEREIRHSYLLCLTFFILLTWIEKPNWQVIPYVLIIFLVGLLLHVLKILGAGDTKLVCVISLAIQVDLLGAFLYGAIFLGGLFALLYLLYGYLTDLELARKKGVPYAVPISISGGAIILLSHISLY